MGTKHKEEEKEESENSEYKSDHSMSQFGRALDKLTPDQIRNLFRRDEVDESNCTQNSVFSETSIKGQIGQNEYPIIFGSYENRATNITMKEDISKIL